MFPYPTSAIARDDWILDLRPPRHGLDPWRPHWFKVESEMGPEGYLVDVVTIFLSNRECPWRCVMCDLWRNTLRVGVPTGAITVQVEHALRELGPSAQQASVLKLYNAGSFFDPRAIPPADHRGVASLAAPYGRTIVECHPALVGPRCMEFRDRLTGRLEVAMGLETAHPVVLERLNKRMTLEQFSQAAQVLKTERIDLRVYILVRPPWLSEVEGVEWARRSLDFAFACGASVCSLMPTRPGNGALEALAALGEYAPPCLSSVEAALEYGLRLRAGRVFADLWNISMFARCPKCSEARIDRLKTMNATQQIPEPIHCDCGIEHR